MLRGVLIVMAMAAQQGCAARAAWDVATLPVRAASKTVDLMTTSQAEADRNRGRAMRHAEARDRREARRARASEPRER